MNKQKLRIAIASVLGGLLIFMTGAFAHMALQWGDRAFRVLPDESAFLEFLTSQSLSHGVYGFPGARAHSSETDWEKVNELYKRGPNGVLFVGRTGEDMMSGRELGLEFGSNVFLAFIAAFVVSRLRVGTSFGMRWLIVVLIGLAAWFSISASHAIWYRFPWEYVRDEFLCAGLESSVAGLAIAALVRPADAIPKAIEP
jgi:hypothetical protein